MICNLTINITPKEHEILSRILDMDDLYGGIPAFYGKDYIRMKEKVQKAGKRVYTRVCKTCGKEFKGTYNQLYCSETCRNWEKKYE